MYLPGDDNLEVNVEIIDDDDYDDDEEDDDWFDWEGESGDFTKKYNAALSNRTRVSRPLVKSV